MNPALLPLSAAALLLSGCATAGQAVRSATHILGTGVRTVTGPLRGMSNAADPGPGTGWKEGIQRLQQEDTAR